MWTGRLSVVSSVYSTHNQKQLNTVGLIIKYGQYSVETFFGLISLVWEKNSYVANICAEEGGF